MNFVCRCTLAMALVASSAAGAQPPIDGDSSRWSFTITPYLWAAGIDGSTAADGVESEIDTGYSFFSLDNLDFALATGVEARKGRWTVLLDGLYTEFSDAFDAPGSVSPEAEVSGGYFETSAAYPTARLERLEVVFGMRYVALESTVQLTPTVGGSARESWLDPLVGVRFQHEFNDRWSVTLRGDVGGFGVSSDLATNVSASFGYRLTDVMSLRFGYRALQLDFADDEFVLDAITQGYAVGVSFAL